MIPPVQRTTLSPQRARANDARLRTGPGTAVGGEVRVELAAWRGSGGVTRGRLRDARVAGNRAHARCGAGDRAQHRVAGGQTSVRSAAAAAVGAADKPTCVHNAQRKCKHLQQRSPDANENAE